MPTASIILDGTGAFSDVPRSAIAHTTEPMRFAALPGGMSSGAPSIMIGMSLPGRGGWVLGETSLAVFLGAATAFEARYGNPSHLVAGAREVLAITGMIRELRNAQGQAALSTDPDMWMSVRWDARTRSFLAVPEGYLEADGQCEICRINGDGVIRCEARPSPLVMPARIPDPWTRGY